MRTRASAAVVWGLVCAVVAGLLAGAAPVRAAERYVDPIFDSVTTTPDIVYGRATNSRGQVQDLTLTLHQPAGDDEPFRPVFLYAPGGFFRAVDRCPSLLVDNARRGWVTICMSYRVRPELPAGLPGVLLPENLGPTTDAARDAKQDMQAAVRWVQQHAARYRMDAGRIVVAGHSAGGITAQGVAFDHPGPLTAAGPDAPPKAAAAISHSGGWAVGLQGTILPGAPPVGYFHAVNDTVVPFPTAVLPCATTTAMLNMCELTPYPSGGHSIQRVAEARDFAVRHAVRANRAATALTLGPLPASGHITDGVPVRATLTSGGTPLAGRRVTFELGGSFVDAVTGPDGAAEATVTPVAPAGPAELVATFSGEQTTAATRVDPGSGLAPSRDVAPFEVVREATVLAYTGETHARGETVSVGARLADDDGSPIAGATVAFAVAGHEVTAVTDGGGSATASIEVPDHGRSQDVAVAYAGDDSYEPAATSATISWGRPPD